MNIKELPLFYYCVPEVSLVQSVASQIGHLTSMDCNIGVMSLNPIQLHDFTEISHYLTVSNSLLLIQIEQLSILDAYSR